MRHETDSDHPRPLIGDAVADSTFPSDHAAFTRSVMAARRAKDEFFARSRLSPLPHDRRHEFAGLAYYPPDPSYRLGGLRLEPVGDGEAALFAIDTSDNRPRTAHRLGRLRFSIAGREATLTAYRTGDDESDSLFVPFRDETSGHETYGAGRYLDIEPQPDGTYILDFNDAYHPYCAYSDSYSCPLPPIENWLPIRIEAGERLDEIDRSAGHG